MGIPAPQGAGGSSTIDRQDRPRISPSLPLDRQRAILRGAAGRDFRNFNRLDRDWEEFEMVTFPAAQIPNTGGQWDLVGVEPGRELGGIPSPAS